MPGPGRLDPARLRALLADLSVLVEYHERVDSTNTRAQTRLGEGLDRPLAVLADGQSAGRGRAGSRWHTPFAEGLALSYALPDPGVEPVDLVRCACLALCDSLERCGCRQIGIKWPNDVMLEGRKVGGILIESGSGGWVIGIGANLNNDPDGLRGLTYPAASVHAQLGQPVDRTRVAVDLVRSLYGRLRSLPLGAVDHHRRWVELSTLLGRRVRLLDAGRSFTGIVAGLGRDGSLELESSAGRRRHHSGSIDEVFARRS